MSLYGGQTEDSDFLCLSMCEYLRLILRLSYVICAAVFSSLDLSPFNSILIHVRQKILTANMSVHTKVRLLTK